MGITIKKIAEIVGVSRGTVDRVIHGRYGVKSEIRARIEQVMKELDYKPNTLARALKKAQKSFFFGIIIPSSDNKFYLDIKKGIFGAVKIYESNGVRIELIEEKSLVESKQIEHIDYFLSKNVDGIIMAAIDSEKVREKVNSISTKVPVVTYNTDLQNSARICFVGQDHFAAGRVAADLMYRVLENKNHMLAVLISNTNMLAHMERLGGFLQAMEEKSVSKERILVCETYESDELANKLVQDIAKQKDIAGIFVAGGGQEGAGIGLLNSGEGLRIKMICCDTLPDTVRLVKEGIVDFTLDQNPFLQGYTPIKVLYEYLALDLLPNSDKLLTNIDIRVKDNIEIKGYEAFTKLYTVK